MSRTRGAIVAMFVLVIGAMSVAACGGDDDTAKTSATATNQEQSSATAHSTEPAAATTAATAAATQPANGGGGDNNPCTLLTKSEVEAAFGVSMNDGELTAVGDTPITAAASANVASCAYTSVNSVDSVSVDVWASPDHQDAIAYLVGFVCSTKESVSGLGDTACWYSSDHNELQFAKGANYVDMHGTTATADVAAILQSLGAKVVDRLP